MFHEEEINNMATAIKRDGQDDDDAFLTPGRMNGWMSGCVSVICTMSVKILLNWCNMYISDILDH